jgi:hypothetical protein
LQQQQQSPLHQEEYTQEEILEKVHIPNKKHTKKISRQSMIANFHGKKVLTHQDDKIRYFLLQQNRVTIAI